MGKTQDTQKHWSRIGHYWPLLILIAFVLAAIAFFDLRTNLRGAADGLRTGFAQRGGFSRCRSEDTLKPLLKKYLPPQMLDWKLVKLRGVQLLDDLSDNSVELPLVTLNGDVVVWSGSGISYEPLSSQLPVVYEKTTHGEARATPIPLFHHYRVGCGTDGQNSYCASITFLDKASTLYEIIVGDRNHGFAAMETVKSLLLNLTGKKHTVEEGCSIIYNVASLGSTAFPEVSGSEASATSDAGGGGSGSGKYGTVKFADGLVSKTIPIVLDAAQSFYKLDPSTVWSRQTSVHSGMQIIYNWIEPISGERIQIDFPIKGMEAWLPGQGPSTVLGTDLTDDINDEEYFMFTHPDNKEVSYFFVGHDVLDSLAGEAGAICKFSENGENFDVGYGTDEEHPRNHAWGQQIADKSGYQFATLAGRVIVMAHEIGHLIGGLHGLGEKNECAGGVLADFCGNTIMLSGAAGGLDPDFRVPFFSNANDDRIAFCVSNAD